MNHIEFAKQAGRCWKGYEPVPGKTPYSAGSCQPVGSKSKKKKPAEKKAEAIGFSPDLTPDQIIAANGGKPFPDASKGSMAEWPEEWKHGGKGWIEWYRDYAAGERAPEDEKQIQRWRSFVARHGSQYKKKPTDRRANALRNWAVDPDKLLEKAAANQLLKFAAGVGGVLRMLGRGLGRTATATGDYVLPTAAGVGAGYGAYSQGLDPVTSTFVGLGASSIASPRDYVRAVRNAGQTVKTTGVSPYTALTKELLPMAGNKAKFVGLSLIPAAGSTALNLNKHIGNIGADAAEMTRATKETLKGDPTNPDKPGVLQSWQNAADNVTNIVGDPKAGTGIGGSLSQTTEGLNKTLQQIDQALSAVVPQPQMQDGKPVLGEDGKPVLQGSGAAEQLRNALFKDTLLDLKSPYTWAAGGLGLGALGLTGASLLAAARSRRRRRNDDDADL